MLCVYALRIGKSSNAFLPRLIVTSLLLFFFFRRQLALTLSDVEPFGNSKWMAVEVYE